MPTAPGSTTRSRRAAARKPGLRPLPAQGRSASPIKSSSQGSFRPQLKVVPLPSPATAVRRLPLSQAIPTWLRWLVRMQRGSLIIAIVLVTAALAVYGSTVYTQQLWSKEYHRLQTMERNERQMVTTQEALKNQLAQQAERPASGLIPRTPDGIVTVPAAPQRSAKPATLSSPKPTPKPAAPLGY